MRIYRDVLYVEGGVEAQRLDMYLPDGDGFPTLVFFHGGGFEKCDKAGKEFEVLSEYFVSRGIGLASANYRMYPDARFPDYIEDGASAVAWVKAHISEYGGSGDIYAGGSSAGAYLSMLLCYDKAYLSRHGLTPKDIKAYIHDAGQPTVHFNVLREDGIPRFNCRIDARAPIYHVGEDKDYPPQQFFVASRDIPCRYEETMLLMKTFEALGYDMGKIRLEYMEGYGHTEYLGMRDADGESIFGKRVCAFLADMKLI